MKSYYTTKGGLQDVFQDVSRIVYREVFRVAVQVLFRNDIPSIIRLVSLEIQLVLVIVVNSDNLRYLQFK